MKKLSYFISLACIALFASCSSDVEEFNAERSTEGKTITIGVSLPDENDTRVNTDALDGMVWEAGDVLKAICWGSNGWQVSGSPVTFNMSEGAKPGTSSTSFTGTIPAEATSCMYVYTKVDGIYYYQGMQGVNLPDGTIQEQSVINSSAHIKNYLVLASETFYSPNIATGNVQLTPQNPILRLNVKNMPKKLANATSCNIKWSFGSMNAEMNLNCQMVNNSDNFIYMVVPTQFGYSKNDIMKVEFTSGLNTFVAKAQSRVKNNMGYKGGKIYTAVIDKTSTSEAPALVWEKDYDAESEGGGTEPELTEQQIFIDDFTTDSGSWTDPRGWWVIDGGILYGAAGGGTTRTATYEGEVITLGVQNTFSFKHVYGSFTSASDAHEKTKFEICGTDGVWVAIDIPQSTYLTSWKSTGAIVIPDKFDKQNVKFRFSVSSTGGTRFWNIDDFEVRGYK